MFDYLLNLHKQLDEEFEKGCNKPFISSWQCKHPYIKKFIPSINKNIDFSQDYVFYSDEKELKDKIINFHKTTDNLDFENKNIFLSDGSSAIIYTFILWLYENNIKEIYYISPLYHTFYYFFEIFNIKARKVSARHPFENKFSINLPSKQTILIITDPVWYAGHSINKKIIKEIKKWQEETNSYIFVDGSMQYMKWKLSHIEYTSILDKNLTFRLICPTKILAIHSFRFSYLLMPKQYYEKFLEIYSFSFGSTNKSNIIFAKEAIDTIILKKNNILLKYIQDKFNDLVKNNFTKEYIKPNCGYFIFAKPYFDINPYLTMHQDFFDLKRYNNYIRINLLSPDLEKSFFN